jgi:hypothetical protein
MKCTVVNRGGGLPNVEVDATPFCGVDFCDECGDCLACYGDGCEGGCRFLVDAEFNSERAAELLASVGQTL